MEEEIDYFGNYAPDFKPGDEFEISNVDAPAPPLPPMQPLNREHTMTIHQGRQAPVDYNYRDNQLQSVTRNGEEVSGQFVDQIARDETGHLGSYRTFVSDREQENDQIQDRLSQLFANRPFTQLDNLRLTQLQNGIADTQRRLEAGQIPPNVAMATIDQLLTPVSVLEARKQMDEEKKRQLYLQQEFEQNMRMTAQNNAAAAASNKTVEQRSRYVPAPDGGYDHIFTGVDGKEQVSHIAPAKEAAEVKDTEIQRQAKASVAGLRPDLLEKEKKGEFDTVVADEFQAAKAVREHQLPPPGERISDGQATMMKNERDELVQRYPQRADRPPAIRDRIDQLSLGLRRYNEQAPTLVDPQSARPGQRVDYSKMRSADETRDRLKAIDAEIAKRQAEKRDRTSMPDTMPSW